MALGIMQEAKDKKVSSQIKIHSNINQYETKSQLACGIPQGTLWIFLQPFLASLCNKMPKVFFLLYLPFTRLNSGQY